MIYQYYLLRMLIVSKFNSYKTFAQAVGMSYPAVLRRLSGSVAFSPDEIETWSRVLGLSYTDARVYFFMPFGIENIQLS